MKKRIPTPIFLLIALLCFFPQMMKAQKVTLSGIVKDASNGEALMGAYIILTDTLHPGDPQGCISNQAGFYSITVPAGSYRMQVSYLSYQSIREQIELHQSI